MSLMTEQQQFLGDNFYILHEQQGKTLEAAKAAAEKLSQVDDDLSNQEHAVWHGELACQVVVLFRSAAAKAQSSQEATEFLEQSLLATLNHYPVASDMDDVQKRTEYWKNVFGPGSAYAWCLRDFIKVLTLLQDAPMWQEDAQKVQKLLDGLHSIVQLHLGETAMRILRLEESESRTAVLWAFFQYLLHDSVPSLRKNRSEFISVTKKFAKKLFPGGKREKVLLEEIRPALLEELFSIEYIGMGKSIYSLSKS